MTTQDENRVEKILQGAQFPADKQYLISYALDRDADERSLAGLGALPDSVYSSIDDVAGAIPHRPDLGAG